MLKRLAPLTLAALFLPLPLPGAPQRSGDASTKEKLNVMLRQFLVDAAHGNAAGFETFFADDVIYTRSAGIVTNKAEIMKSVSNSKPTTDPKTTYSAEDVTVHDYGETAVVAFQLVARTERSDGKFETSNYRNTGTFLRRKGRWQVVAWQSTKMPDASTTK